MPLRHLLLHGSRAGSWTEHLALHLGLQLALHLAWHLTWHLTWHLAGHLTWQLALQLTWHAWRLLGWCEPWRSLSKTSSVRHHPVHFSRGKVCPSC